MKAIEVVRAVVSEIKELCKTILAIVPPVAGVMIGADIILGTKFGVLERLTAVLAKVGFSGNLLTILLVVGLVLWYNSKK